MRVCPRITRIYTNVFQPCADGVLPTDCTNVFSLRWWFFAHELHELARMFQLALMGVRPRISRIGTNVSACADGVCPRIARIGTNVFSLRWWGLPTNLHECFSLHWWRFAHELHECFSAYADNFFAHEFHELTRMFQLALMGFRLRISRMFSACADGFFAHEFHELTRMFSACADGFSPTNFTNVFSLRWWG